ncbi:MAG TPA: YciI family protein [Bryobacteraceae bacterium]|nr:YciI family protein [Bryobacteraceae bacterium]
MRYLLLAYIDEKAWAELGEAEQSRVRAESQPHVQNLSKTGRFISGAGLRPTSTAVTVKVEGGKRLVTDGPFAETREQLGGYALIDANDLDEAIGIAGLFAQRSFPATIEIRPLMDGAGAHPDAPVQGEAR